MIVPRYFSIWIPLNALIEIFHAFIILILGLMMGPCVLTMKYCKALERSRIIESFFRFMIDRVCWKRVFVYPRFEKDMHVQCRFLTMATMNWDNTISLDVENKNGYFLVIVTTTYLDDSHRTSYSSHFLTDGNVYYMAGEWGGQLQPCLRDPFHFMTINEVRAIKRELKRVVTSF